MNEKKICFIMCSNNEFLARECQIYIEQLIVPEDYEVEVLVVYEATSMTGGYNEAMRATDAKYKVYLHHDVLIINPCFMYEMLALFQKYPEIGMFGMVGNETLADNGGAWTDGTWRRVGEVMVDCIFGSEYSVLNKAEGEYAEVIVLDGLIMVTQYDLPWREDLFEGWDFYDCSQSIEFWKAGYKVVVPSVENSWCIHDNDISNMQDYDKWRKIFLNEYGAFIGKWMVERYPALADKGNLEKVERIGYSICDMRLYEIRPGFNITWYKGVDQYFEGDIEDRIIQLIFTNKSKDYTDVMLKEYNWSVYYHLTNIRENLLNWYPFPPESSVLEIGCGMGAITNMLCERCRKVTAVELSKKRATATVFRCRDKDNLEVIVGDMMDIEFQEKYDYITLIGVLEYQGSSSDFSNPYIEFLKKIKGLLKPGGKLLIAIENKYGLKYWCGAKEDHTGIPFDGINQYGLGDQSGRTFSKEELATLIRESGFAGSYFYYPMPDYKLPNVIYSEDYLPDVGELRRLSYYYIPDTESLVVDEAGVYDDLIRNHVFEFFSNSFLVECSIQKDELGQVIFAQLGRFRNEAYQLGTRVRRGLTRRVEKFSLTGNKKQQENLVQIQKNSETLSEKGLNVVPSFLQADGQLISEYMERPTLLDELRKAYLEEDKDQIWIWFDRWFEEILRSSEEISIEASIIVRLGLKQELNDIEHNKILKTGYIDMLPWNCFVKENEMIWFDQEWSWDGVPAKFIFWRGIMIFYHEEFNKADQFISIQDIWVKYHIDEDDRRVYKQLENYFLDLVVNRKRMTMFDSLCVYGPEVCQRNVFKLLNQG